MKIHVNQTVTKKSIQQTLETQLKFYFPEIEKLAFLEDHMAINYFGNESEAKIIQQVDKIINKFKALPHIPQKVFFDSETNTLNKDEIDQSTLNNFNRAAEKFLDVLSYSLTKKPSINPHLTKQVYSIRKGLNIYRDDTALLFQALDVFFKEFYQLEFDADELKVPSMISSEIVDRAGYFETGCQHISFVSPISNDPEKYEAFLPTWKMKNEQNSIRDYLKEPKDILNPALCLHCYPLLQDQVVSTDEVISFTVLGSCFRDESGNLNNLERLNEFTMREAVFIGNPEQLKNIKTKLETFSILFGAWLGLQFRLEAATDIFFDENAQLQLFSQLASSNKIEFSVYSSRIDKYMASGSINNHQNHFSKKFDIKDSDLTYMNSMCIGFGFNRLVLALSERLENGLEPLHEELENNLYLLHTRMNGELSK